MSYRATNPSFQRADHQHREFFCAGRDGGHLPTPVPWLTLFFKEEAQDPSSHQNAVRAAISSGEPPTGIRPAENELGKLKLGLFFAQTLFLPSLVQTLAERKKTEKKEVE